MGVFRLDRDHQSRAFEAVSLSLPMKQVTAQPLTSNLLSSSTLCSPIGGMGNPFLSLTTSQPSITSAKEQAQRCLKCHVQTVFNSDLCLLCGGCVDICPMHCLKLVPVVKIEGSRELADLIKARYGENIVALQQADVEKARSLGTAIIKDETQCIRCGLCSRSCTFWPFVGCDFLHVRTHTSLLASPLSNPCLKE